MSSISPDARCDAAAAPLTPRERAILQMVSEGYSDQETAERLGLSYETVRTHIRNSRNKLQARNRPHAVAVAIASGEIDGPAVS